MGAQASGIPPRLLVDIPTAGLLEPGSFETRVRAYPGGGVEGRLDIGLPWRINVGASYGGLQIIGDGDPQWNPHLGLSAKIRVAEETYSTPAFAIGIDTQGSGFYDEDLSRYQFKSRGVYAIASKNYAWLGDFTMHGGMSLHYPGDPAFRPLAMARFRDEKIVIYEHEYVAVIQPDGSFEVSRMN